MRQMNRGFVFQKERASYDDKKSMSQNMIPQAVKTRNKRQLLTVTADCSNSLPYVNIKDQQQQHPV